MHFDVIFKLSATLSVTVLIVVSGKEMLYLDAHLYKRWRPSVDPSVRSFVCAAFSKVKVTMKLSKKEKEKENKYRGGTSDATTSSPLSVSLRYYS